jgi:hypothetical protein
MLAPVLFKDEDTLSMSKLFRNPVLFQVSSSLTLIFPLVVIFMGFQIGHLIIYGPNAVSNAAKTTHRSDSPYVRDGHLPKATSGFIAWIATMVR